MTPSNSQSPGSDSKPRILVFEDEDSARKFFHRTLQSRYQVEAFPCVEDGLGSIAGADLIVSDWEMPGLGGQGLMQLLDKMPGAPPLVIVSGLSLFDARLKDVRDRNLPFLAKPLSMKDLLTTVAQQLPMAVSPPICP